MIRPLRLLLALVLAVLPGLTQAQQYAARPLPARAPAFSAVLAPFTPLDLNDSFHASTLNRVLAQTDLTLETVTPAAAQDALWTRLETLEAALETEQTARRRADVQAALADLAVVRRAVTRDPEAFAARVDAAARKTEEVFARETARLIAEKMETLDVPGAAQWAGRTAHVTLPGGDVLAFKRFRERDEVRRETEAMNLARRIGVDAPIPLPAPGGDVAYLPYLIPKSIARGYRSYVNDRGGLEETGAAMMRGIDDMVALAEHGHAHESLAPISHSKEHWEWDYWRWVQPWFGKMRFGPSSIHGWKDALRYPNLRGSGMADYEHIKPLASFEAVHEHFNHGTVEHDAFSLAIGQNLTEFAFLALDAGRVNGWNSRDVADLIWNGFERYARQVMPADAVAALPRDAMRAAIGKTARRFRWLGLRGFATTPLVLGAAAPLVQALRERSSIQARRLGHPSPGKYDQSDFPIFLVMSILLPTILVGLGAFPLLSGVIAPGSPLMLGMLGAAMSLAPLFGTAWLIREGRREASWSAMGDWLNRPAHGSRVSKVLLGATAAVLAIGLPGIFTGFGAWSATTLLLAALPLTALKFLQNLLVAKFFPARADAAADAKTAEATRDLFLPLPVVLPLLAGWALFEEGVFRVLAFGGGLAALQALGLGLDGLQAYAVAAAASAALFASVHRYGSWTSRFFGGLFYAAVYALSGSFLLIAAVHFLHNAVLVVAAHRAMPERKAVAESAGAPAAPSDEAVQALIAKARSRAW